jgi:Lipocalin-like domain
MVPHYSAPMPIQAKCHSPMARTILGLLLIATVTTAVQGCVTAKPVDSLALDGTWVMVAAYEILADGRRTTNYGEHPQGLLMVDKGGHYSLQIFRPGRPHFASNVKANGTAEEYREAALGSSTHTGLISIDPTSHELVFQIESSSYPNWENTRQARSYTFKDGILTYSVPASASGNGTVAYSVWQRIPS